MKTKLRKELDKEHWNKLLLKDASLYQVMKHVCKRYSKELTFGSLTLVVGVLIGSAV